MELFPPLHLQFEQSFSYTPAYCSDRPLRLRVCRIFWSSPGIGSDTRWDQNPLVSGRALFMEPTRPRVASGPRAGRLQCNDSQFWIHGRQRRRSTIELLFASRLDLGFRSSLQTVSGSTRYSANSEGFACVPASLGELQHASKQCHLPVAVLPALIAFPKNCKHKH